MALSAALIVCAALLVTSLARVLRVDPGFDPTGTTTFRVTPPRGSYATADLLADYYDRLLRQLRTVPGVTSSGAASTLPLGRGMVVRGVIRPGDTPPPPDQMRLTLYQVATPGYLGAIGARLIAGRDFNDADTAGAEPVTIINEAMAAALWPNQPALGREIFIYTDEKRPRRVVGIIQDMRQYGLDQRVELNYFVPMRQAPVRSMSVVLRSSGAVDGAAVRRAATTVDPTLPIYDVQSMADAVNLSLAPRESLTLLLVLLSAIGIALAAIGLYGNVASNVAERRREIGVRLALGAQPRSVLHLLLRQSLLLTLGAAIAGVLVSRWAVRLLEEQLFGVTAADSASPVVAMLTLIVAGLLASWIPARRALRIDPARTLRME
jgi:predicted permease